MCSEPPYVCCWAPLFQQKNHFECSLESEHILYIRLHIPQRELDKSDKCLLVCFYAVINFSGAGEILRTRREEAQAASTIGQEYLRQLTLHHALVQRWHTCMKQIPSGSRARGWKQILVPKHSWIHLPYHGAVLL